MLKKVFVAFAILSSSFAHANEQTSYYNGNLVYNIESITEAQLKDLTAKYIIHPNCSLFVKNFRNVFNDNLKEAKSNITNSSRNEFLNILRQLQTRLFNTSPEQQEFACYLFNRKLDNLQDEPDNGEANDNSSNLTSDAPTTSYTPTTNNQ